MVPTWACIQGVFKVKVKVKGHVTIIGDSIGIGSPIIIAALAV